MVYEVGGHYEADSLALEYTKPNFASNLYFLCIYALHFFPYELTLYLSLFYRFERPKEGQKANYNFRDQQILIPYNSETTLCNIRSFP